VSQIQDNTTYNRRKKVIPVLMAIFGGVWLIFVTMFCLAIGTALAIDSSSKWVYIPFIGVLIGATATFSIGIHASFFTISEWKGNFKGLL